MHSTAAVSVSASAIAAASGGGGSARSEAALRPGGIRFCGLRGEALACRSLRISQAAPRRAVSRAENGVAGSGEFDYDLVIIGAGVGGHGAALHAVEEGLKTAVIEGDVVGGTCVNRGCVPSKALLAVSGRMRELHDEHHMKSLGLQVSSPRYDRQAVADHANNLASKIRSNLTNSMKALGVDVLTGIGKIVGKQKVRYGKVGFPDKEITAKNIIIATGSVPFVPKGIEIDGKTVFTSDHALKLESVPDWIAIVGSGYIGLEFSDVYTALGSECVEERLRRFISTLIRISKQRIDMEKTGHRLVITSDVSCQILQMNQKAKEEWDNKQAEETDKNKKQTEKHMQRCQVCYSGKTCYFALLERGLSVDKYTFLTYLCYLTYAPLYIVGPIVSYNAFAAQVGLL